MNKAELLTILDSLNMHPGRGLGQNYLLDGNLLDFIVRSAAPQPGETVLEVGPGFGALSEKLLDSGAELYAVEFDYRAAGFLRKRFAERNNLHLTEGDGCKIDYQELLPAGEDFCAIANLPYSISSVLIARFLTLPNPPARMFFMLQKEMALRLCAVPRTHSYGALSVRVQQLYDVRIVRLVPPEVFFPVPGVDSALVEFVRRPNYAAIEARQRVEKLARVTFANRRKQLGKTLKQLVPAESAATALAGLGIAPTARPEELTVAQFELLALALKL